MTKKALRIEPVPQSGLLRIVWEGGGELPAALSGHYTSALSAKQAIASWEAVARDEPVEVVVQREQEEERQQDRLRSKDKTAKKDIAPI